MSENTYELVPQAQIDWTDETFNEAVENAFSTGLAAAIMSEFPIASMMAISRGNKGKTMVAELDKITEQTGRSGGAKRILAKIFSIYGHINGIVCTALYAFMGTYIFVYSLILLFYLFIFMVGGIGLIASI